MTRLLFKQRLFSWFDSYDIYDEMGNTVFTVKGAMAWGHCLHIYGANGSHIGTVKEEIFTYLQVHISLKTLKMVGDSYGRGNRAGFSPFFQL